MILLIVMVICLIYVFKNWDPDIDPDDFEDDDFLLPIHRKDEENE